MNQRFLSNFILFSFAAISLPAQANMEVLLEKLHKKGVLSDSEYQEMRAEARQARRSAAIQTAQETEHKEKRKAAEKKELTGKFNDGFSFTSGDGEHSIKLTGRVNADYRFSDNDYSLESAGSNDRDSASIAEGFELRRARLGISGKVYKDIGYEVQLNGVGSGPTVDTALFNLGFYKPFQFQAGRFKQPFSLEQLTSSNNIDFAERSYNDQMVPSKKLGAMFHGEPMPGLTYAVSVFQEGFSEGSQDDGEGKRHAARLTANFAQLAEIKDTVLHVGIAGVGGDYQVRPSQSSQTDGAAETTTRATIVGFRSMNRGLSNVYRAQIGGQDLRAGGVGPRSGLQSETLVDVDQKLLGLEFAAARGPFKLQGEYVKADYDAVNPVVSAGDTQQRLEGDVKSYYLQAMWNITGEKWSDAYRSGAFSGIKPLQNFKPGSGWGAWQLGLRYSKFDASDIAVTGSSSREQSGALGSNADYNDEVDSFGVGLNWILNPMMRFMLEYTETKFGGETLPLDVSTAGAKGIDKEQLVSLRAQFNF